MHLMIDMIEILYVSFGNITHSNFDEAAERRLIQTHHNWNVDKGASTPAPKGSNAIGRIRVILFAKIITTPPAAQNDATVFPNDDEGLDSWPTEALIDPPLAFSNFFICVKDKFDTTKGFFASFRSF